MKKKAVIFDLDGTLWDASEAVTEIWNAVLEKTPGIDVRVTPELLGSFMGKTMSQIGELLFPNLSGEERNTIMDECGKAELVEFRARGGGVLYPNLKETLRKLSRKYLLCVVSNCQLGYIPMFVEVHGLAGYFTDYEEADRTGLSKGENIRLVIERNGIDSALYVGDTAGDRTAAEAAGIPFVYAEYGFGSIESTHYVIHGLEELPALTDTILIN